MVISETKYLVPLYIYVLINKVYDEGVLVENFSDLTSHLNDLIKILKIDFKPNLPQALHKPIDSSRLKASYGLLGFCKANAKDPKSPELEKIFKSLQQINRKLLKEVVHYD